MRRGKLILNGLSNIFEDKQRSGTNEFSVDILHVLYSREMLPTFIYNGPNKLFLFQRPEMLAFDWINTNQKVLKKIPTKE